MAIRLSWQNAPAKSLVNAETGMYKRYMRISSTAQRRRRSPQQFLTPAAEVFLQPEQPDDGLAVADLALPDPLYRFGKR